jgi:hypothetical protein
MQPFQMHTPFVGHDQQVWQDVGVLAGLWMVFAGDDWGSNGKDTMEDV